MKTAIRIVALALVLFSCSGKETDRYPSKQADWNSKTIDIKQVDTLFQGKTYLPVYSHIYHIHEHRALDLTITISIRNVSLRDTVYILEADYYNTIGENIRQYLQRPIYLSPLETIEIVIDEEDIEGGSGANFVFGWATGTGKNPPLFEAVMITTVGQQGLSFTTRGVPILD